MNKLLSILFISVAVGLSVANTVRTQHVIMDVDEFFIRTRALQVSQVSADRANRLLEDQIYQNKDLREAFKGVMTEYQRLSFKLKDAILIIEEQTEFIKQLQEKQVCPPQNKSAANSFNSQISTSLKLSGHKTLLVG